MTVDGNKRNKTDAIRRIWRYNSQRHPNVIVNGHVHSLIVVVPLMAPLICMSIREHYPLLLVALCFLGIGEWLLTEWHLYWIGQDRGQDMVETPRRDRLRMLFWVALNWGLIMLAVFVAFMLRRG